MAASVGNPHFSSQSNAQFIWDYWLELSCRICLPTAWKFTVFSSGLFWMLAWAYLVSETMECHNSHDYKVCLRYWWMVPNLSKQEKGKIYRSVLRRINKYLKTKLIGLIRLKPKTNKRASIREKQIKVITKSELSQETPNSIPLPASPSPRDPARRNKRSRKA